MGLSRSSMGMWSTANWRLTKSMHSMPVMADSCSGRALYVEIKSTVSSDVTL